MSRRFDVPGPPVALALLTLAVVVTVLFALSTSSAAFSTYNSGWDGTSGLRTVADDAGVDAEIASETAVYDTVSPGETVAFVLSPSSSYEGTERDRLRTFVREGGTLVVAEDFGDGGNEVLETVGAQSRFDGRLLRDEQNYSRSPNFPITANATETPVTGAAQLTLNRGTAVRPNGATVAVTSSRSSYLDGGTPERYDDETLGAYPVVTVERVGAGYVVAVGDPSLFINAMLDRPGNRAFVESLFAGHDAAILDYSNAAPPPPLTLLVDALRGTPLAQTALVAAGLAAVLIWARLPVLRRIRRSPPPDER